MPRRHRPAFGVTLTGEVEGGAEGSRRGVCGAACRWRHKAISGPGLRQPPEQRPRAPAAGGEAGDARRLAEAIELASIPRSAREVRSDEVAATQAYTPRDLIYYSASSVMRCRKCSISRCNVSSCSARRWASRTRCSSSARNLASASSWSGASSNMLLVSARTGPAASSSVTVSFRNVPHRRSADAALPAASRDRARRWTVL